MELSDILAQSKTVLSPEQLDHYYTQGYLLFPELIDQSLLDDLRAAMCDIVEKSRMFTKSSRALDLEKGHTADNPRLRRAAYIDDEYDVFWALCADSVITDIAADLVGYDLRFRELMLNFKWAAGGSEVRWHQDFVFYPHTHTGTMQFLLFLEDVTQDQGPLQVIPGSHKGPLYEHYDEQRNWTGAIKKSELLQAGVKDAVSLTGPAGSVSVHHSCTIHGSEPNRSPRSRPALVITYAAADAMPYTAAAYPGSRYGTIVRGEEPTHIHHEHLSVPMPPDWSAGYTSIYEHQERESEGK
ncbi:MAG: phytanoyl-CoA dioxygenase family protein [Pseudomonadota bacterium]